MLIDELQTRTIGDRTRIEARFVYEESDLPTRRVYYEVGPPLAGALEASPDAFALCGYPLAVWEGERRLKVEGALDTTLANGLDRAGILFSDWYDRCSPVALEPTKGRQAVRPSSRQTLPIVASSLPPSSCSNTVLASCPLSAKRAREAAGRFSSGLSRTTRRASAYVPEIGATRSCASSAA